MRSSSLASGSFLVAAGVAGGAFGAHGLRGHLSPESLALWDTAVRYLWVGGLGLALVGLAAQARPARLHSAAAACLLVGTLVFSGTVAALALGGPRWLGAVTPVGGVLLIAGFVLLGAASLRR
jgi:uncharacterized membrane protein YgdD (TMEM256/DUF423 family)